MDYPSLDWADLRVFLALANTGTVRAASRELKVTHPTVSRRIAALEKQLGARLFERLPSGYALTPAGQEVRGSAVQMEELAHEVGRRVLGIDAKLSGRLQVTLPTCLAVLLMPNLAAFCEQHPQIDLALSASSSYADLSRREADVAIRLTKTPPEGLAGQCVAEFANAAYASLDYLADHDPVDDPSACRWIGWRDEDPNPRWVRKSAFPDIATRGAVSDPTLQLAATKAGLGIGLLCCLDGDSDPSLRRLPPGKAKAATEIWVLTHPDLRRTTRVRVFVDFITQALQKHKPLLEGRQPQPTWRPSQQRR